MKSFKSYLIPSIIAAIFMSCYAIIDGIFIGQSVGDIGLSAINIAWPITSFLQCIAQAIGLSSGILISVLMGQGKKEDANRIKLTSVLLIVGLGLIFGISLLIFKVPVLKLFQAEGEVLKLADEYITIILFGTIFQMLGVGLIPLLKNSGKSSYAMIASITSIVVNFGLDYLLIMHFDYGLKGAALASVIAQASACLVCVLVYIKELKGISLNKEYFKRIFVGALAPFILNFSYSVLIIITNAVCLKVSGYEAVAAYTLLSYLLYIVGAAGLGAGDAIQPLFSYHYAKDDYKENRKLLKKTLLVSFIVCLCINAVVFILRKNLGQLFNLSDDAFKYYMAGIIPYAIGFLFVPFVKVFSSYLYSVEKKMFANLLVILEPVILTPIGYLILVKIMKLNGVWYTYLIVQVIIVAIGLFLVLKANKNLENNIKSKNQIEVDC